MLGLIVITSNIVTKTYAFFLRTAPNSSTFCIHHLCIAVRPAVCTFVASRGHDGVDAFGLLPISLSLAFSCH